MTESRRSDIGPDANRSDRIRRVLPGALLQDLDVVLEATPRGSLPELLAGPQVTLGSERLMLLARFYSPEPDAEVIAQLTMRQRLILSCLYTRHHDGFIRERYLPAVRGDQLWLPPFTLQLVGDYVIEVVRSALANFDAIPIDVYHEFAESNPAFISLIRARVVSYGSYYMHPRQLAAYPGFEFLDRLGFWPNRLRRRWMRRARPPDQWDWLPQPPALDL